MNNSARKIVAVAVSAGILFVGYYGSWLPLKKSQSFITSLRSLASVQNLPQLEEMFDAVFMIPSPIGQEEVIRNFSNVGVNMVGNGPKDTAFVDSVIQYIEKYYQPIIQSGKGMSFAQNLYTLGGLYQTAFFKTQDPKYLQGAAQYYLLGERGAPNRPQFLYGLLDVYRLEGNVAGVTEVSQKILSLWPNDDRVHKAVDEFMKRVEEFQKSQKAAPKTPAK